MKRNLLLLAAVLTAAFAMAQRSAEAQAVINILKQLSGQKCIICSMANVNWNTAEADNVHQWTGKYPAMTTFDFIHAPYSKDVNPYGWLDYSDMTIVKDWWQQGGIVSCMWHWLMPTGQGQNMSFYTNETNFDPTDILHPESDGYKRMVKDMDQIASYFQQMKELGIPVVWRPLHEAAGNSNNYPGGTGWFWWGSKGGDVFKALWRFMYNYFTQTKGLDNLIWVWNGGINDDSWYPGDEYVDVVGDDYYGNSLSALGNSYQHLTTSFPTKLVALTECGHSGSNRLPSLKAIWQAGQRWVWAMPWYDYNYNSQSNPTPSSHDYYTWFTEAMQQDIAVDRAAMKQLLDQQTAIQHPTPATLPTAPAYNLQGQRVGPSHRGIVITNGKKVIQ